MEPREETVGFFDRNAGGPVMFDDRRQAGAELGDALRAYRGRGALVLGIPRGGVPVAREVAERLDADLDVIVARKIGAPGQEELALGAVTADGTRFINEEIAALIGASDAYLERVTADKRDEAMARERRYRAGLPPLDPSGRIVILVDDGLATGATMRAAIRALRRSRPSKLIVAVPVGARETCEVVAKEVDELVCVSRPEPLFAIGLHYRVFTQTRDEEVEAILREQRERRAHAHPTSPTAS